MDVEETGWSWIAQLEGNDPTGAVEVYTRAYPQRGRNQFVLSQLYEEGDYELVFHEVDVPDYEREMNLDQEDLRELVDDHGTGRTIEKSVDVTASQVDSPDREQTLGRYDFEHQACR